MDNMENKNLEGNGVIDVNSNNNENVVENVNSTINETGNNNINNGSFNGGFNNQVNNEMVKKNSSNKKLFIFGGIGLAALFLIFTMVSSNKNLYCSKTEDVSGMELTSEFTIEFEGRKVSDVELLMTADLGYLSSYRRTFKESLEDEFRDYEYEGIDVDIWDNGNDLVYVKLTADEDAYDKMGYVSSDTLKEIKEDFESDGYYCYED